MFVCSYSLSSYFYQGKTSSLNYMRGAFHTVKINTGALLSVKSFKQESKFDNDHGYDCPAVLLTYTLGLTLVHIITVTAN